MPTGAGQAKKTSGKEKEKTKKVLKLAAGQTEVKKPLDGIDPEQLVFAFDIRYKDCCRSGRGTGGKPVQGFDNRNNRA